jgi:hypothetical protein
MAGVLPYRPGGQKGQEPMLDRLYRPVGHTATVAFKLPGGQLYPAAQGPVHPDEFVLAMLNELPYRPPGQARQAAAPPSPSLYVAMGQGVTVALVEPAGQE